MRLGSAPITWGVCEMEGWGERLPFNQVLDEIAACGYAGTELGPPGYLPTDPRALRHELESRHLAPVGSFCPVTLHRGADAARSRAEARALAELLAAAGARFLVLADAGSEERLASAGRLPSNASASFDDDEWARFADAANGIAADAAALGIRAVFHPEAGSYVETEAEIERLLSLTDPSLLGLCLDTGHVAYGGGDPAALAGRHRARVEHVHAKDVDPEVLRHVRHEPLTYLDAAAAGIFVPAGRGMIDFSAVFRVLDLPRADLWVIVEQDIRIGGVFMPQDPAANARASREHLLRLAG